MDAELDKAIVATVGRNYAIPRMVRVDAIEFDDFDCPKDLLNSLTEFLENNKGTTFEAREHDLEYGSCVIGFIARRPETEAEVATRVEGYRSRAEKWIEARRAEYEKMKLEFNDNPNPETK